MIVEPYTAEQKSAWDDFVRTSRNGTFLFFRDYMDYHRDRFADCSLLIRDARRRLVALLPANRAGDTVASHGGLTYGGFITDDAMTLESMLRVLDATLTALKNEGVRRVVYRTIPHIYHRTPAEEDRYALFAAGARRVSCGALAVVPREPRLSYQERRSRGIKRARSHGVTVSRSTDFDGYWAILTERLDKTYGARPVHTTSEIVALGRRFPDHIKLFVGRRDETLLAGVVVYETATVARTQYIASTDEGRALGAVDLLLDHLLTEVYAAKPYFDLGTSERDGYGIHRGLIEQKEGFGARTIALEQYDVDLEAWRPGRLLSVVG